MKTCPGACGVSAARRFLLWDATGVGADVFLDAGLMVGGMGLLAPVWVGPAPGTSSSFAADGICKVHSESSF